MEKIVNPRTLFLIDGMGAILSATILGIVLPQFEYLIGMPITVLHYLAIAACIMAIYSLTCYVFNPIHWRIYLTIIAVMNLTYCALSLGLVLFYYPQLTQLGLAYFIIEKFVVVPLALIEIKTALR